MNSNTGNEANGAAAEAAENEFRVTDKRRVTPESESVAEPEDGQSPADNSLQGEIELLQVKLKEAEEKRREAELKLSEHADKFRRAQEHLKTETEEMRARLNRTAEQRLEAARGDLVAGLLDTLDNLKRAVAAAEISQHNETDFNALLEGVKATANLFETKMQNLGLSALQSEGEDFNPELHEAVEIVPVEADQDNKVIAEYQTGYKFGDRLLRPARVRVGRAS
ncbi:MAG TPA: nucleotide exchange factor GrpE [Blastocatellia bacterium]|nr:nucleotide exchange factor GrpE [Blastocatellia bacterium]